MPTSIELRGETWTESLGVYFQELKIPDITNPQPKYNFSKTDNVLAYFSKIMTDDMIQDIVTFTSMHPKNEPFWWGKNKANVF
jgi:hypothetical protein